MGEQVIQLAACTAAIARSDPGQQGALLVEGEAGLSARLAAVNLLGDLLLLLRILSVSRQQTRLPRRHLVGPLE